MANNMAMHPSQRHREVSEQVDIMKYEVVQLPLFVTAVRSGRLEVTRPLQKMHFELLRNALLDFI